MVWLCNGGCVGGCCLGGGSLHLAHCHSVKTIFDSSQVRGVFGNALAVLGPVACGAGADGTNTTSAVRLAGPLPAEPPADPARGPTRHLHTRDRPAGGGRPVGGGCTAVATTGLAVMAGGVGDSGGWGLRGS